MVMMGVITTAAEITKQSDKCVDNTDQKMCALAERNRKKPELLLLLLFVLFSLSRRRMSSVHLIVSPFRFRPFSNWICFSFHVSFYSHAFIAWHSVVCCAILFCSSYNSKQHTFHRKNIIIMVRKNNSQIMTPFNGINSPSFPVLDRIANVDIVAANNNCQIHSISHWSNNRVTLTHFVHISKQIFRFQKIYYFRDPIETKLSTLRWISIVNLCSPIENEDWLRLARLFSLIELWLGWKKSQTKSHSVNQSDQTSMICEKVNWMCYFIFWFSPIESFSLYDGKWCALLQFSSKCSVTCNSWMSRKNRWQYIERNICHWIIFD